MYKILIFEDPRVVPVVTDFLREFEITEGVRFDVIIAPNSKVALKALPDVDMAIIDVWNEGREVAHKAVNEHKVPIVATVDAGIPSRNLFSHSLIRFLRKPAYDLKELRDHIRSFISQPKEHAFAI